MISYSTEFFGLGLGFSPSMYEISGLRGLVMSRFYTWCDCMFHFCQLTQLVTRMWVWLTQLTQADTPESGALG